MEATPNFDAVWKAIGESPFLRAYLHELRWLAADVVQRLDSVFAEFKPLPPGQDVMLIRAELLAEIYAALGNAAKIRALITKRGKGSWRGQTETDHGVLVRRADALRAVLDGLPLDQIESPGARNSVEHFDEKLDRTAIKAYEDKRGVTLHIYQDMLVSTRAVMQAFAERSGSATLWYPLRVFIASERVFLNADDEIDLGKLRDQCAGVRDRIEPLLDRATTAEERGGFIIVITPQTFEPSSDQ